MTTGGCTICGRELWAARTCLMPIRLPEDIAARVPQHCNRCHFAAIAVAKGIYKVNVLPPPHAQPAEDFRGEFERADHGDPLPDVKGRK